MAKKKPATKKATPRKAAKKKAAKATVKKTPVKKKAAKKAPAKKAPAKKASVKKAVAKKTVAKKPAAKKAVVKAAPKAPVESAATKAARKKGVRRATMTTGIRTKKSEKKIGRSRIPVDAPLSVVFEHFPEAQDAFQLLQVQTIRELEEFEPDELVRRLTSPAKQTVGKIRKILAMNNRCLANDEAFAIEFQGTIASKKFGQ